MIRSMISHCRFQLSRASDRLFLLFILALWAVKLFGFYSAELTVEPRFYPCHPRKGLDLVHDYDRPVAEHADAIPNLVHFVRMGGEDTEIITATEAACIASALRTQPDCEVLVHTDRPASLRGSAWDRLLAVAAGRVRVLPRARPLHVFGLPFRDRERLRRLVALRVLMEHGGMYVSGSACLTADLSVWRSGECAATADGDVILARRDARQLRRWLHRFHDAGHVWDERPPSLCRQLAAAGVAVDLAENMKRQPLDVTL